LPNVSGATFIPDSRVVNRRHNLKRRFITWSATINLEKKVHGPSKAIEKGIILLENQVAADFFG
jgi:hypothetical protein